MKKLLQKIDYLLENEFPVLVAIPTLVGIILLYLYIIIIAFAS